ncbi:PAS domain-containing sensor histidine kinase [Flaviaesturariibacter aridisoli]|uniref:histidine kinase n=1 Tax=Flaviaesturariibacter aridisoli TaxID=2545761 RepID=A0A4R4E0D1_9BACT|nr:PAS domain-containing sensor histidine kinase [Flaviaesturariibacter aridisoli]TCZ67499.1 PAS domain S-box protein [Flaviaesturariibacter aridisoli]
MEPYPSALPSAQASSPDDLQQALRDSELHRALSLEGGALGTYEFFPELGRMNWSDRTKALFGLPPEAEITLAEFRAAIHPDDLPRALANLEAAQDPAGNGILEQEYRVRSASDGSTRWLRSKGKYFPAQPGQAARFAGVVQDITSWKESEYWLTEGQQRLQAALTASGTGTFRWNIQTNGLSWDENLDRLFGLPPGQTVRSLDSFIECVHPDDRAAVIECCCQCADSAADFDLQFRVVWPDGTIRWLDDKGKTYLDADGRPAYMTGACVDITARRQAEEALRASEARLRMLTEALPQLSWMRDATSHKLEYASNRWQEYSGIEDADLAWASMVHPDDKERAMQVWQESMASATDFREQVRLRNRDGEYRWHLSIAQPVRDGAGQVTKWTGTLLDIHEQKSFEETLERIVGERTRQLQQSNDDLQQFAHVASHDLKEPLRKARLFLGCYRDEARSSISPAGETFLNKVEGALDRMHAMVEGVLAYSLLHGQEFSPEPVNLADLLQEIAVDLEVPIHEKDATLHYQDLPLLKGSRVLLYQLFYNLLKNALKFTRAGVPPVLTLTAPASSGDLIIEVRDNGIGFAPDQAKRIFEPFTRLHSKDQFEGTGLGLALCQKIMERHGGSIRAEGREGEGAVFFLAFPFY